MWQGSSWGQRTWLLVRKGLDSWWMLLSIRLLLWCVRYYIPSVCRIWKIVMLLGHVRWVRWWGGGGIDCIWSICLNVCNLGLVRIVRLSFWWRRMGRHRDSWMDVCSLFARVPWWTLGALSVLPEWGRIFFQVVWLVRPSWVLLHGPIIMVLGTFGLLVCWIHGRVFGNVLVAV